MTSTLPKAAAMALALCAAAPLTATMAEAKVCKSYSVGKSGAKKLTNLSARLSARWAWHLQVKGNQGFVWSTYALANAKGYDCHRVGIKWRCEAYGRPCRLGN
jgi:hypothetical protein